jgi:hypothetical protein
MMKTLPMLRRFRRGFTLLAGLGLGFASAVACAAIRTLPAGTADQGPVAGGREVSATIYLRPDVTRSAALKQFLVDVQTPGGASYHHWVTAAQFSQAYGASPEQIDTVRKFATGAGMSVTQVSALRVVVSGPAGLVEKAFAPALHVVADAGKSFVANTADASVPTALTTEIAAVGGMTTLPESAPLSIVADGKAFAPGTYGSVEDLATVVETNAARVVTLGGSACAGTYTEEMQEAVQSLLQEASAQGITVLVQSGCAATKDVSFPAVLPEVVAIVAPAGNSGLSSEPDEPRPSWQAAPGLPADQLRHEPDATVDMAALSTTLESILASMPANADGTPARLGNVAQVLYELAPSKGLFTQPDGAAAGTWETGTGLGALDLKVLQQLFPRGALTDFVQVTTNPSFANHGTGVQFQAEVKDTSGNGTTSPGGTVTFTATPGNYALGTGTLISDGATSSATSVTYNQLPATTYTVLATYSGDGQYTGNSNSTSLTVGPEEGKVTAAAPGSAAFGSNMTITITDTATSGVGPPNVKGYIIPQGISSPPTYSVQLTGTGASASGTVTVPATNAGTMTLLVGCTSSDPSFTCFNSFDIQVSVSKGNPNATLTVQPNPLVAGLPAALTTVVTGVAGQALPTGTVVFFDNGVNVGSGSLDATGKISVNTSNLSSVSGHNFTATYFGDVNYGQVNANSTQTTGGNASTTVLTLVPNPPVSGQTTTLQAAIFPGATSTTNVIAAGTVTFYQDGVALTPTVGLNSSGVATYTSTALSSTLAHQFSAIYSGDTNYASSTSNTVASAASGAIPSTSTLSVTPNPPVSGATTTLQVVVASNSAGTTNVPTGTVAFFQDGVALTTTAALNSFGVASFTSTALSGATSHVYAATYSGNSIYSPSNANSVATSGASTVASTTTLSVTPNPPVSGATTTLQAVVASGSAGTTTVPTGTVTFFQDGVALTTTAALNSFGVASYSSTALSGTAAHIYTATYSGNSVYNPSNANQVATSGAGTVASTTTLSVTPNPPVSGATTILQAVVASGSAGTTTVPTGTVTFFQDGVALTSTAALNSFGVASFSSTTLSGATAHIYTATYSGNSVYNSSNGNQVATSGAAGTVASTTTLSVTPNPPVNGATTTLQAVVASGSAGITTVPTGTMTFFQDSVPLTTTAALNSFGVASFSSTTLSGTAAHIYTATYSGNSIYNPSNANQVATSASTAGATTTTLAVTPNPPVSGSNTTLQATIGYTAVGAAIPTGTVTFLQDGVALTPASQVIGGTSATFTSTTLSGAAAHSYTAIYSGDPNYLTSTATAVATLAATGITTTTTVTAAASSVAMGGTVALTATVAGPTGSSTPTGQVRFTSSTQGVLGVATLTAGVATLSPTFTVSGASTITATYSGDMTFATSTSVTPAAVTVNGTNANAALTLTVSPTITTYGSSVTLTSMVTATPTSGTTGPTGSVSWVLTPNVGGAPLTYTATLFTTSGTTATATLTIPAPAAGTYTVTASCVGTNFSCTGLTAVAALSVQKTGTSLNLVASPNPPVSGQPEVLTAYITPASGTTAACSGVVTFYVNGASVGNGTVSGNQATYILTLPSTTSNTLYAVYSGDTNCQQSLSQVLSLSVPPAVTTSVITPNASQVLQGATVTFTVVVSSTPTATNPNPGAPTGTVNLYNTLNGIQSPLGSASLVQNGPNSSLATYSTTGLKAGTDTVQALYAGSKNYAASDAGTTIVNVTDYGVAFSPASSTVAAGQTATVLTTVTAINNFVGEVVLNCVPPANSATTCAFNPAVLTNGGGVTTLTITTTAAKTAAVRMRGVVEGVSFASLVLCLLWPGGKRRRLRSAWLAVALGVMLAGSLGCTTVRTEGQTSSGGGGSGPAGGGTGVTPSGTLQFAVTASGTDGRTTSMHTYQYAVTIQ